MFFLILDKKWNFFRWWQSVIDLF